ncbi:ABC transporter substrate-binding protein [Mesorhizobium sp. SB112]|uniref:ABC transporter substrate-binding protein n=1 Tax=Mesorhizobium sp. SB112 TaxID=3151853 RepID=UPI0032651FB7
MTDIAGRKVTIAAPAKRILLEMPNHYFALSLLSRDAENIVIGVGGTTNDGFSETYGSLADTPRLGWTNTQTFSIESALALKPDLLIANLGSQKQSATVEAAFLKAGVPVIYVDFFVEPITNIEASIGIIGDAIGEKKRAEEFIDFYRERVRRVANRLEAAKPDPPALLLIAHRVNEKCCWSWARWGMLKYFDMLHVTNIADAALPGFVGQLGIEYVIGSNPEIVVTGDYSMGPNSLFDNPRTVAHGLTVLEELANEPGLRDLTATRNRRIHGMDAYLMHSPLNILALEVFAKWIHPKLFADLDPQATLDEINDRFLSSPLKGPFWVSLDAGESPSGGRP